MGRLTFSELSQLRNKQLVALKLKAFECRFREDANEDKENIPPGFSPKVVLIVVACGNFYGGFAA